MKVIGITGGAGSGKSYVCQLAQKSFGWPVIDSDSVTRDLMNAGSPMLLEIIKAFGEEYLKDDGNLNRAKMAEVVFGNPAALQKLNSITHPATISEIKKLLFVYEEKGCEAVIVESALADQVDYDEFCDELWMVYANEELRAERLRLQRGYSMERIQKVMESQATLSEYGKICRRMIINEGNSDKDLIRQIRFFFGLLR